MSLTVLRAPSLCCLALTPKSSHDHLHRQGQRLNSVPTFNTDPLRSLQGQYDEEIEVSRHI